MDFEFLLDSSGSVGINNWELMTKTIADKWIPLLNPVFGETGVHIASRWFSSNSERFINFQEKSFVGSGKVHKGIKLKKAFSKVNIF